MCDICHQHPCAGACPNAPEPPVFATCRECGGNIYDGEDYYKLINEYFCEDCVSNAHEIAEVER